MTPLPNLLPLAARTLRGEGDQLPGRLLNQPPEAVKKAEPGLITAPEEDGRPPPGGHLTRSVDAPVDHLTRFQLLPLQETLPPSMVLLGLPQITLWRTSLTTGVWVGRRIWTISWEHISNSTTPLHQRGSGRDSRQSSLSIWGSARKSGKPLKRKTHSITCPIWSLALRDSLV